MIGTLELEVLNVGMPHHKANANIPNHMVNFSMPNQMATANMLYHKVTVSMLYLANVKMIHRVIKLSVLKI